MAIISPVKILDDRKVSAGFKVHFFQELAVLEEGNFWFRGRNRIILWALRTYYPEFKSFLEIGCGTGFVIAAIAKQFPTAHLFGSEYFEEGLAFARQRVPVATFTRMDARSIPYDSELDAVGAFDVLEHIEDDEIVLQQIYKALKPDGYMFITVPQHRWLWSAVDEYGCHFRRYGVSDLHEKVATAGFNVIRSTSFVSILLPAMYLSRLLHQGRSKAVADAKTELYINPVLNKVFEIVLNFELMLIRVGFSLPVGGSRLLVAHKPGKAA